MTKIAFRKAKAVVPVSTALKDALVQKGILGNFHIIPNVVDDEVFHFKGKMRNTTLRLLYVGLLDLSDNKGLPILFQALKMFAESDVNWQLDIIGDGPGRENYQGLVRDNQLKDYVVFHGFRIKSDVACFMADADLFLLPSIKETFSVVTAEALATGTPVVATKCGGPEDYLDRTNSILVEAGDPEALYKGLLSGIDSLDSFENEGIARNARSRFSPAVIGEEYTKIYSGILNGFNE